MSTLLTNREAKDMIRTVVASKGTDAFFDSDDIRNEIQNVIEVPWESITEHDVEQIRDLINRVRINVTFGRSR